jgi:hypothetical protein
MKRILGFAALALGLTVPLGASPRNATANRFVTLPKSVVLDKIRGGWAGQVIGCTFGGPTEFVFNSTFIPEYQPLAWTGGAVKWYFDNEPGLYDDVYMDLTFVRVLEEEGLDASAGALAAKFARAAYPLWHANQMARYNILNGIAPPESGHWLNNPHADDIDFQIEADFAGLMCPGLVNAAAGVCDRVGHIMNYGDGYYGGLYVAAMYSLAFVESDVQRVVEKAPAVIPARAAFARTIRAVIDGHRRNPADWQKTWFEVERDWGRDVGCPEGVFRPFNIDARMNASWVVLGLLYGGGDFGRTITVSCRCGDDSDCNPASAGGILGAILGFDKIPEFWKAGLEAIRDRDFPYTNISLSRASELSFEHALKMIGRNGGTVDRDTVRIRVEEPVAAPLEVGFEGHYPQERRRLGVVLSKDHPEAGFEFEGIGFAVNGAVAAVDSVRGRLVGRPKGGVILLEMRLDGGPAETIRLPLDELVRKPTPCWKYQLKPGKHKVRFRLPTPLPGTGVRLYDAVIYGDTPPAAAD